MSTTLCMGIHLRAIVLVGLLAALPAAAQEGQQGQPNQPLDWRQGPITAPIGGDLAEIELPEGYLVLDGPNTQRLMEYMQNPVSGSEVATVASADENAAWFIVFEWSDIGYVEDEEGAELDPDAILASIREGTEIANEERKERGWPTMKIVGWQEEPHYDYGTNNLTWAIIGESEGGRSINRIVKLLGRRGVMTATLVAPPEELTASAEETDVLLAGYRFRPGSTYAEYVPGKDKLAEIGLTALVVGGAGAALVKSGLLARFWKLILAGIVAVGAGIKRVFGSSRAEESPTSQV